MTPKTPTNLWIRTSSLILLLSLLILSLFSLCLILSSKRAGECARELARCGGKGRRGGRRPMARPPAGMEGRAVGGGLRGGGRWPASLLDLRFFFFRICDLSVMYLIFVQFEYVMYLL